MSPEQFQSSSYKLVAKQLKHWGQFSSEIEWRNLFSDTILRLNQHMQENPLDFEVLELLTQLWKYPINHIQEICFKDLPKQALNQNDGAPFIKKWTAFLKDELLEREWKNQYEGHFGGYKSDEYSWKQFYLMKQAEFKTLKSFDQKYSWAIKNGHRRLLNAILNENQKLNVKEINPYLISHIVQHHWSSILKDLLDKGISPNLILPNNQPLLHWAVLSSSPNLVEILLKANADPNLTNENGLTALHIATLYEEKKIIQLLLSYNAKQVPDPNGVTPLGWAILKESNEVTKLLLQPNASNMLTHLFKFNIFHLAAIKNNFLVFEYLKPIEEQLSQTDIFGRTPLHWAIQLGSTFILNYTLQSDLNLGHRDNFNLSAREVALTSGNELIPLILEPHL